MATFDDIPPSPPVPENAVHDLKCVEPQCPGGLLQIRWSYRLERWFYGCEHWPRCTGTMPANQDGKPRGKPRTKELQGWRNRAHQTFDPIWKNKHMSRGQAYAWLKKQLGWDHAPHMGEMTIEECQKVIEIVRQHYPLVK